LFCSGEGRGRAKKGTIQRNVKKEKARKMGNTGIATIFAAGSTRTTFSGLAY